MRKAARAAGARCDSFSSLSRPWILGVPDTCVLHGQSFESGAGESVPVIRSCMSFRATEGKSRRREREKMSKLIREW